MLAEELHFARAAAKLHISQPTLSVQIGKLERTLGVQLLIRTTRSVQLTAAGEALFGETRLILQRADRLVEVTRRAAQPTRPFLVGVQTNAAAELTPMILRRFREATPHRRVEVRSMDLTDPHVGLGEGKVQVAFVRPPFVAPDWLDMETLFIEPRILAMPASSPLAQRASLTFADVVDLPFVVRRAPERWRDYWLARDQRGTSPVVVGAEVSNVDECLNAILSGHAVSFTQASTARFLALPGLVFRSVDDVMPSTLSVAWRRDAMTDEVRSFIDICRQITAEQVGAFEARFRPSLGSVGALGSPLT